MVNTPSLGRRTYTLHEEITEIVGQGAYLETDMVVERLPLDEGTSEESIETIARLLHRRPSPQSPKLADISAKGSLPCLGYRMEPAPELVFRKPEGNLFMLHTLIAADQDEPRYPLDFRFQLARSLSEAVLGVHVQGLVHKNIRTDTILLVARPAPVPEQQQQQQTKKNSSMDVYLTNWHLLRKESDATIMSGGTQWAEDLYRHPRRQGLHVQERYNIGHDIYSLGVCLLEIGLWSLLLIRQGDGDGEGEGAPPQVSRLVRAAAGVAVQGGEVADAEMRRKLKRPDEVKNILLRLAWDHLPQRMGRGYCRLVVACLTALDHQSGGFREGGVDWRAMSKTEQGVAFREFILSFFTDMSALFDG
ncbi:Glycosyltransferase sugar-binding region containing DXD domain-containing protein [Apiospora arundinis]